MGQEALYKLLLTSEKNQYCIQLPTGYGKSWCACIAYATLRSQGRVNRVLFVVPTDQQRSQYVEGLREDFTFLEIPFTKIQRCDNKAGWVIKESHTNSSEIFVAGVQSIVADPGYYADLMSKGRWLVVADEFHHYGEDNTWGEAIKNLSYEVILGMSATPFRADNTPTIFGSADFDIQVSVQDAYEEGAIKRIEAWIGDYAVSFSTQDAPDQYDNFLMSEMAAKFGVGDNSVSEISSYEIQKGVRYSTKYVSEIFLQVLSLWNSYESKWPNQNQILVFAMSCRHAEMIAGLINNIAFPGYPQPFADWIGVGQGLSGARSDKENADVLARFQDNKLPCLVQVNKAGEGFNNKRCSIGLFLDLVGDTPTKRQHIGRFMRVNRAAPDQTSVIFISEDSPAKQALENIEAVFNEVDERREDLPKRESKTMPTRDNPVVVPDIFILDTEFCSERRVSPFGTLQESVEMVKASLPEHIKQAYQETAKSQGLSEAELEAMMERHIVNKLNESLPQEPQVTEEERRKAVVAQVMRNAGVAAATAVRKRYGKSFPSSVKNDLIAQIHRRWKSQYGPHSEMTVEDLRFKNQWLQDLTKTINEKGIPTWLSL